MAWVLKKILAANIFHDMQIIKHYQNQQKYYLMKIWNHMVNGLLVWFFDLLSLLNHNTVNRKDVQLYCSHMQLINYYVKNAH